MSDSAQWVAMGYIKGVFGIKGWLKVKTDTEYADSLLDYRRWRLHKDGRRQDVEIEDGKIVGSELQVKFAGIDDRDQAALLRGYTVEIPRDEFAETEEDEYYWVDLVGMQVKNRAGETIGTVQNLMETGAHDILVVAKAEGKTLIPFVSQFIDGVDRENRTITADWSSDY